MKIAFLDDRRLDYTPDTPLTKPLGGTQSAAVYLAQALARRGHSVTLINETSSPGEYGGVHLPGRNAARKKTLNEFDAVIVLTDTLGAMFRQGGVTAPLVCWQHMSHIAAEVAQFKTEAERTAWTGVVYVSDHQRDMFEKKFGLNGQVIRNAASPASLAIPLGPDCFLDRNEDPTLIYASAPGRGLDMALMAFAVVREHLPKARLRVCSGMGIYQMAPQDDPYFALYALARAVPGVDLIGTVGQAELAREFSRADILAFPTNFLETSCIVAMEAAVAGCLYVGNDYGPLRETMAGYGLFMPSIDSRPATAGGVGKLIVDAVRQARADPAPFKARRVQQAQWFSQTHTWDQRAQAWESYLTGLLEKRGLEPGEHSPL